MKELRAKQKKYLKSLINKEIPTIQIGKEGITDNIIKHINSVIESRELIKIKIFDTDMFPLKETASIVSRETSSNVIRTIGKTFILYKESKKLEKDKRIAIPS